MFATPEFWVFVAFALFLAFFGKRGLVFLTHFLDEHRQKIARQLDEAQRLHDEALSLLNTYKRKHEEALEQANNIMALAEKEALEFRKSSEQGFEKLFAQKEKALLERIALETEKTKTKLKNQAADEAFAIVERTLSRDPKQQKKVTRVALKEIQDLDLGGRE